MNMSPDDLTVTVAEHAAGKKELPKVAKKRISEKSKWPLGKDDYRAIRRKVARRKKNWRPLPVSGNKVDPENSTMKNVDGVVAIVGMLVKEMIETLPLVSGIRQVPVYASHKYLYENATEEQQKRYRFRRMKRDRKRMTLKKKRNKQSFFPTRWRKRPPRRRHKKDKAMRRHAKNLVQPHVITAVPSDSVQEHKQHQVIVNELAGQINRSTSPATSTSSHPTNSQLQSLQQPTRHIQLPAKRKKNIVTPINSRNSAFNIPSASTIKINVACTTPNSTTTTAGPDVQPDEREEIQRKSVSIWISNPLDRDKEQKRITDIVYNLRDDHILLNLLGVLMNAPVLSETGSLWASGHLGILRRQKVRIMDINNMDLVEGNPKMTLALVWAIILHWKFHKVLSGLSPSLADTNQEKILLAFTSMLQDPDVCAFCSVLLARSPGLLTVGAVIAKDPCERLPMIFRLPESHSDIQQFMDRQNLSCGLVEYLPHNVSRSSVLGFSFITTHGSAAKIPVNALVWVYKLGLSDWTDILKVLSWLLEAEDHLTSDSLGQKQEVVKRFYNHEDFIMDMMKHQRACGEVSMRATSCASLILVACGINLESALSHPEMVVNIEAVHKEGHEEIMELHRGQSFDIIMETQTNGKFNLKLCCSGHFEVAQVLMKPSDKTMLGTYELVVEDIEEGHLKVVRILLQNHTNSLINSQVQSAVILTKTDKFCMEEANCRSIQLNVWNVNNHGGCSDKTLPLSRFDNLSVTDSFKFFELLRKPIGVDIPSCLYVPTQTILRSIKLHEIHLVRILCNSTCSVVRIKFFEDGFVGWFFSDRLLLQPFLANGWVKIVPAPRLVCIETNPGPFTENQYEEANAILSPLKFLGFYENSTPSIDIIRKFDKLNIELAFARKVCEDEVDDAITEMFILNYGQFLRECPNSLDFEFLDADSGFFFRTVESPRRVTLSAIVHMEVLIHKSKQTKCQNDLENVKNFIAVLAKIDDASIYETGLSLPTKYRQVFSEAYNIAKTSPYQEMAKSDVEDILPELVTPSVLIAEKKPLEIQDDPILVEKVLNDQSSKTPILPFDWSSIPEISKNESEEDSEDLDSQSDIEEKTDDCVDVGYFGSAIESNEQTDTRSKLLDKKDEFMVQENLTNQYIEDEDVRKTHNENKECGKNTIEKSEFCKKLKEIDYFNEHLDAEDTCDFRNCDNFNAKDVKQAKKDADFGNNKESLIEDARIFTNHNFPVLLNRDGLDWSSLPSCSNPSDDSFSSDCDHSPDSNEIEKTKKSKRIGIKTALNSKVIDLTVSSDSEVPSIPPCWNEKTIDTDEELLKIGDRENDVCEETSKKSQKRKGRNVSFVTSRMEPTNEENCFIGNEKDTCNELEKEKAKILQVNNQECGETTKSEKYVYTTMTIDTDEALLRIGDRENDVCEETSKKSQKRNVSFIASRMEPTDEVNNQECGETTKSEKYVYSTILQRSAKYVIGLIKKEDLDPIWTDSRYSLLLYMVEKGLVHINHEQLKNLQTSCINAQKYFNILENCFKTWPNEEVVETFKEGHNYGTKKLILNKSLSAQELIRRRPFKALKTIRAEYTNEDVKVYQCQGSKVCQNEDCLFQKTFKDDELVTSKLNSTKFVEKIVNKEKQTFCLYCKTDGIESSTIKLIECPTKLYWKTKENIIYTMHEHTCCEVYRLQVPSSFEGCFERNRGYNDAVKHNLTQLLKNPDVTLNVAYKSASTFSVGSRHGTQAKHSIIGKPSPVKKRLEELLTRLKKLDKNIVLADEDDLILISSTRSLKKAFQFDQTYGHYGEPGFIDVCFSKVQGTQWVASCFYFYDPVGCLIIKVFTAYIPSESVEYIAKAIRIFNRKLGALVGKENFRLKPKQIFVDFSDVNRASFLAAGYLEEEVNGMLEGCGKHFRDMSEQLRQEFPTNEDKSLFEAYLFDYKNCVVFNKMEKIFDTLRNFVLAKIKDKKTKEGMLKRLQWWKDRETCWSKAYSGLKHVDSNLSESGHSPSLKFGYIDESIMDDVITDIYKHSQLTATGNGSLVATGAGPNYERIQALHSLDLDDRLKQIEEEFRNPTENIDLSEIGEDPEVDLNDAQMPNVARINEHSPESNIGRKLLKRGAFSQLFLANLRRFHHLKVRLLNVAVDTDEKKVIFVKVSTAFGVYSVPQTCTITFSKCPVCDCSDCVRMKCKKGKREVCSPQIWMRIKLLGMSNTGSDLNQVVFSEEEVRSILSNWVRPTLDTDDEGNLENLFKLKEVTHKPSEIKYFLEKTTVHTTRRRCFSGAHPPYGKDINTPPGNLNICVEGGLKVIKNVPEAVPGPIYLCAKNSCAYEKLPKRSNLKKERCPVVISIRDPYKEITAEEVRKLETEEAFAFEM